MSAPQPSTALPHTTAGTPTTTQQNLTTSHALESRVLHGPASYVAATLRIAYGLTFLWAFIDKVFGFGFATPSGKGWLDGGSPTKGYLSSSEGPFSGFYHSIAGQGWANLAFMLALVAIGGALTLGIGMRLAAIGGAVLYLMMWSVALPPTTNPFIDDHILGALVVVLLALVGAGLTWGLGAQWNRSRIVGRFPILR